MYILRIKQALAVGWGGFSVVMTRVKSSTIQILFTAAWFWPAVSLGRRVASGISETAKHKLICKIKRRNMKK